VADYLVTGGAGFLGSNLVRRLAGDGHRVTVFDSLVTGRRENLGGIEGGVDLVKGDVRDTSILLEAFASRGFECAFHLAALPSVRLSLERPQETHDTNATGTLNVLAAARAVGCRRVVFASSCAVYGDKSRPPLSEDLLPDPLSPYAAQKLLGESYCSVYSRFLGVEAVSLRFFNIFGPRQDSGSEYAAVVPRFIQRLLDGLAPVIHGDGKQTRDFVFVEDAVNACILAAHSAKGGGRTMNIGSGSETAIAELAGTLTELVGADVEPAYGPAIDGEVRHSCADIALAAELLGYSPAFSLTEGLKSACDFFRQAGTP
jgi:UDP-glucose 4-epimerase